MIRYGNDKASELRFGGGACRGGRECAQHDARHLPALCAHAAAAESPHARNSHD